MSDDGRMDMGDDGGYDEEGMEMECVDYTSSSSELWMRIMRIILTHAGTHRTRWKIRWMMRISTRR